jgi:hypothetical protein
LRNAIKIVVGNPEGGRPLWKPQILNHDGRGMISEVVDCIQQTQYEIIILCLIQNIISQICESIDCSTIVQNLMKLVNSILQKLIGPIHIALCTTSTRLTNEHYALCTKSIRVMYKYNDVVYVSLFSCFYFDTYCHAYGGVRDL